MSKLDHTVPSIVRIVLRQSVKARASGALSNDAYRAQLHRLVVEELTPRDLSLDERSLPDGRVRFLIKNRTTHIPCDLIECPELPAADADSIKTFPGMIG